MKFKNLAYATFVAAAAVAFVIGSAVPSEAARRRKRQPRRPRRRRSCAPADRLRCAQPRATRSSLITTPAGPRKMAQRPPSRVHAKRPRQGRRQEKGKEEKVIRNSVKHNGPLLTQRPVFISRVNEFYFLRGGIWSNSAICSLVNGFSRNFNFTASATAPSRSANLSVCSASFGWNFAIDSLSRSTGR